MPAKKAQPKGGKKAKKQPKKEDKREPVLLATSPQGNLEPLFLDQAEELQVARGSGLHRTLMLVEVITYEDIMEDGVPMDIPSLGDMIFAGYAAARTQIIDDREISKRDAAVIMERNDDADPDKVMGAGSWRYSLAKGDSITVTVEGKEETDVLHIESIEYLHSDSVIIVTKDGDKRIISIERIEDLV